METCVLIPQDLSLVLQARPRRLLPAREALSPAGRPRFPAFPEMGVAVWANRRLAPGTTLRPDDGEMRLDKLEIYSLLRPKDVRHEFGCHDNILEVEGQDVRHCNWVRFVHSSSDLDEVNVVASKLDGKPVFQVVKPIFPNEEIVVYFNRTEESSDIEVEVDDVVEAADTSADQPLKRLSDEFSMTTHSEAEEADVEDEDDEAEEAEEEPSADMEVSIEMTSVSDVSSYQSSTETSPVVPTPTAPSSREEHTTPENRSMSSCSDQATPVCERRLPAAWTGFSPQTGAPAPCTPSRFARDMELKVLQGPLRRKEKTWLPCDVCGKKFDRPSLLKRHMRTHTGEKPHACDVCGKAFSTSSSLNTHRRIHSGEKPHQCQICGKRFTASSNLYYHRMTHKKEKPHKCSLCSKSFPTPGDLKSHMYVHNGSWPFKCDICNRGFSKQTNLKNHMLLHTGDKPHECPLCRKKFALQCNLRTHLKTHEGEASGENRCVGCGRAVPQGHDLQPHGLCQGCLSAKHHQDSRSAKVPPQNPFSIDSIVSPERPGHPSGSMRIPSRPVPFPLSRSTPEVNKSPYYASAMMSAGILPVPFSPVGAPQFSMPWPQRPSIPHHFGI